MRQQTSIQKLAGLVLLLVFMISVSPRVYFHDALADHEDVLVCHHPETGSSCVHTQPFSCHFNDLVVRAPFLLQTVFTSTNLLIDHPDTPGQYTGSFSTPSFFATAGRSPPIA